MSGDIYRPVRSDTCAIVECNGYSTQRYPVIDGSVRVATMALCANHARLFRETGAHVTIDRHHTDEPA